MFSMVQHIIFQNALTDLNLHKHIRLCTFNTVRRK